MLILSARLVLSLLPLGNRVSYMVRALYLDFSRRIVRLVLVRCERLAAALVSRVGPHHNMRTTWVAGRWVVGWPSDAAGGKEGGRGETVPRSYEGRRRQ